MTNYFCIVILFIDRLKKILGKRSTFARTSAVQSMVVSPPAESQDEEPPNIGSGNEAANEVIDLEGDNQDAGVDEPVGKKQKKTTSECWTILISFSRWWR